MYMCICLYECEKAYFTYEFYFRIIRAEFVKTKTREVIFKGSTL